MLLCVQEPRGLATSCTARPWMRRCDGGPVRGAPAQTGMAYLPRSVHRTARQSTPRWTTVAAAQGDSNLRYCDVFVREECADTPPYPSVLRPSAMAQCKTRVL
eukprot:4754795-Prymnesium_polylepis.1